MKDLIERLEKATGPDRRLDGEIAERLKLYPQDGRVWRQNIPSVHGGTADCPGEWYTEEWRGNERWPAWNAGKFTASLDAALSLVPEGWIVAQLRQWKGLPAADDWFWEAALSNGREYKFTGAPGGKDGLPQTAAIALCIAALKARDFAERDLTKMEAGK